MKTFVELNLSPTLARAVAEAGYEELTPIQAQTIPVLLAKKTDFLGLAATGTGKTAAFSLPLLARIDPLKENLQALVLCPTRELAIQVSAQIDKLGKYTGAQSLPIYGGTGFSSQQHALHRGTYIIVATPGRLLDHMKRGSVNLEHVHTVVLDEADEMISMGFQEDLEAILRCTKAETRSVWLFSATMSSQLRRVAETYLKDPAQVQVNRTEVLSTTVEQVYYTVREMNKPKAICRLIEAAESFYGLVFCQTKSLTAELSDFLRSCGYPADCLHGDKDQKAREKTMQNFRDRKTKILICTDVASRGLDVKDLTHVVNYSLPMELESYVHRIGRTARSGQSGLALSLVTPSQMHLIPRIERQTRSKLLHATLPSRKEIASKKVGQQLAAFQTVKGSDKALQLLNDAWKTELAGLSKEEITARFLVSVMPRFFEEEEHVEAIPVFAQRHEGPRPKVRKHSGPRRHAPQGRPQNKSVKKFDRKRK